MTVGALRTTGGHNTRMAGIRCVRRLPGACMTRRTVGRGRVSDGRTDQRTAAGIVTARTGVMRLRRCAYQRIIMTAGTAGCTYRDTRMAGIRCMGCIPGARMTRRTVGRGRVADGRADQRTAAGIVTARTGVMRLRRRAYQCIIVTVSTAGRTYRDARMAGIRCVRCIPGARMTRRTVATNTKGLTCC